MDGEAPEPVEQIDERAHVWRGYVIPLFGVNSTDGFGVGLGSEIFERPGSQPYGYRFKLTLSTWFTTSLNYTSQYAQAELRTPVQWLFRVGYQTWGDIPYAGVGGADVSVNWGERELGNTMYGPYAMVAGARPLGDGPWRAYTQAYVHPVRIRPGEGGLLDERDPFAVEGGVYADVTAGAELERTDRWPLPIDGDRGELDARVGGTVVDGRFVPLVGAHAEWIHWQGLGGERFVVGTRVLAEKSIGPRPMFEQFVTGGRWRDELGFEQPLTGYGRLRPRGDGVVAGLLELRPKLFSVDTTRFDLDGYLSVFAEQAWLFDRWDPGPPMPSVGFGPELLYQKGSQLRPWVSWGFMSDAPGGPRRPNLEFGLSVADPL